MSQIRIVLLASFFVACFALTSCSSGNPSHAEIAERDAYDAYKNYSEQSIKANDLIISGVSVSSSYGYTHAEGSITNRGDETVRFVEVKGLFQTSSGTTVDTDWTYAVGSEGLAPGETTKFTLSVDKDSTIKKCSVSVTDFDV